MKKEKTIKYTAKQKREAGKVFASMGGRATFNKIGREGMVKIGRKGAKARWGKK